MELVPIEGLLQVHRALLRRFAVRPIGFDLDQRTLDRGRALGIRAAGCQHAARLVDDLSGPRREVVGRDRGPPSGAVTGRS